MGAQLPDSDEIAGWAKRPVAELIDRAASALTVDVEDYFQVEAFAQCIRREEWEFRECRVERNVDRILELFASAAVHGTFFTLGWVADRYPSVVRRIVAAGHELASHGLAHHRADSFQPSEFFKDVTVSKKILEDISGTEIKGYRAPSFSVGRRNLWALEALAEAGYRYSSSVNPIRHDLYGIPDAPRFAFYPTPGHDFMEIPITSVNRLGRNWPCGGGGFFRMLPYWISVQNMRRVSRTDHQPCIFYFHPWEIDEQQPRIANAPLKSKLRHYMNIDKMFGRIERLLKDFAWKRVDEIYPVSISRTAAA